MTFCNGKGNNMADAIVLTDGAKFQCAHMAGAVGKEAGIMISPVASKTSVAGAKPILTGASISGFTTAAGCTFSIAGTPTPCMKFMLPPATGSLTDGGQKVYTEADLPAIAGIPSVGNGIPGLVINEGQTKLKA
jgi:hypothetical protein